MAKVQWGQSREFLCSLAFVGKTEQQQRVQAGRREVAATGVAPSPLLWHRVLVLLAQSRAPCADTLFWHSFLISPVCGNLALDYAPGCYRYIIYSSLETRPFVHAARGLL